MSKTFSKMAAVSKEEYLKRYLSINADSGAIKKRKKKPKSGVKTGKSLIIDDDVNLGDIKVKQSDESQGNLLDVAEENPLIFDEAGTTVLSKDLETIKKKEEARKAMWAPVRNINEEDSFESKLGDSPKDSKMKSSVKRKDALGSSENLSPVRRNEDFSGDIVVRRRKRHDSRSPKSSPERTNRQPASPDLTPPRHGRTDSPEVLKGKLKPAKRERQTSFDQSPPRRRPRHDSVDISPVRRFRHDSPTDQSPPRNRHLSSPGQETFKRKRQDIPVDLHKVSRRRENGSGNKRLSGHKTRQDSLEQSPRQKTSHNDSDQSPPRQQNNADNKRPSKRQTRHDTPDLSPSRRTIDTRGGSPPDLSPPRHSISRDKKQFGERTRHDSPDQSPPRRKRSGDRGSPDVLHKREKERSSDLSPRRKDPTKTERKAGLHSAAELKREKELAKKRESEAFSKMSSSATGKGVETVHRDKDGRKRDLIVEKAMEKEEERKKLEEDEKFMEWGKGLQQTKKAKAKVDDDIYEMSKPLARYKDDEDLEQMLRERGRTGDPMLAFLQKKKAKQDVLSGKKEKPQYKGPAPAPNRFNLRPGYRWDGVDRSNGFERKRFAMLANKGATRDEAYKWSTEDM